MRVLLISLVLFTVCVAFKERNPLKTKKYKCVELAEDEEIKIVKKGTKTRKYSHEKSRSHEVEKSSSFKSKSTESMELPMAHNKFRGSHPRNIVATTETLTPSTTPPNYPKEVRRDSQGRPLILSPEHCQQVKKYAKMYAVTDVMTWVRSNCRMAQMFVPGATCEDINTLVESCYRNKFL